MTETLPRDRAKATTLGEGKRTSSGQRSRPMLLIGTFLLAIAGIALGYALATIGTGETATSVAFAKTVGYRTWRALVAANVAVWLAFLPILVIWLRAVIKIGGCPTRWTRLVAGYLAGIAPILALLAIAQGPTSPLSHQWARALGITLTGLFTIGLLGALGLLVVWQRASDHRVAMPPTGSDVHALFELRRYSRRFLATLGGLIGLALIATGQLRSAVVAFDPDRAVAPEAVLYFGALYTAFLAALYGPTYNAVENLGRQIRDHAAPMPAALSGEFIEDLKARSELAEELGLGSNAKEVFEKGVLIAAPLISGLISFVIGS